MIVAETILLLTLIYLLCGLVFAVAFVARGVVRVDQAARRTSLSFRLILLPGSAALWPLLLILWLRAPCQGNQP